VADGRFTRLMLVRPVTMVTAVALAVRVAMALGLNVTNTLSMAPDAGLYLKVAEVANVGGLDEYRFGYGRSFYRSTWSYTSQVAAGFRLFGDHRLVGQAVSVAYGSMTAGLTTAMAVRLVDRRIAVAVGLVLALLPSQVLWSSVSLRESTIWTCLALGGLLLVRFRRLNRGSDAWVLGLGLACTYVLLVFLRSQTAFLALWCLAAAVLVGSGRRVARCILALSLLVVPPTLVNRGVGDVNFVQQAVGNLGTVRAYMSMDAESALVELEEVVISSDGEVVVPLESVDSPGGLDSDQVIAPDAMSISDEEVPLESTDSHQVINRDAMGIDHGPSYVIARNGQAVAVHNELSASVSAFPRGLVAVALRPFPWEDLTSLPRMLAGLESGIWAGLYVLAAVGVWRRRKEFAVMAFPFLFAVSFLVTGAVTQGNLGTAFRHRGQVLWALALMAGIGYESLHDGLAQRIRRLQRGLRRGRGPR